MVSKYFIGEKICRNFIVIKLFELKSIYVYIIDIDLLLLLLIYFF